MKRFLATLFAGFLFSSGAFAETGAVVPQFLSAGCSAVDVSSLLTITGIPGMYIYIVSASFSEWQDGTGATTTTGKNTVSGLNSATEYLATFSFPTAVNTFAQIDNFHFNPPVRSYKAGVNVAFAGPTAAADVGFCQTVTYYFSPGP